MSNHTRREAIRAYMREHDVNYTTAKRAVEGPAGAAAARGGTETGSVGRAHGAAVARAYRDVELSSVLALGYNSGDRPVPIGGEPLTVISGDAKSGKTQWASRIVRNALLRGDEVTVITDNPTEWAWASKDVHLPDLPDGGALRSAERLLEEAVRQSMRDQSRHLWVVVDMDGVTARDVPGADVETQERIDNLLVAGAAQARSCRTSLVVTTPAPLASGWPHRQWLAVGGKWVVLRSSADNTVSPWGAEVLRRARELAEGEALLVDAGTPDGTKITGDYPEPHSLALTREGRPGTYVTVNDEALFTQFCYAKAFGEQISDEGFSAAAVDGTVGTDGSPFQPIDRQFWDDTDVVTASRCGDGVADPWRLMGTRSEEGSRLALLMLARLLGQEFRECASLVISAVEGVCADYDQRCAEAEAAGRSSEAVPWPTLWMVVQRVRDLATQAAIDEVGDQRGRAGKVADTVEALVDAPLSRLVFAKDPAPRLSLRKRRLVFSLPWSLPAETAPVGSLEWRVAETVMDALRNYGDVRQDH